MSFAGRRFEQVSKTCATMYVVLECSGTPAPLCFFKIFEHVEPLFDLKTQRTPRINRYNVDSVNSKKS
jgi:hypothetical protein